MDGLELDKARFEAKERTAEQPAAEKAAAAPGAIAADIDNNGSTSAEEIIRADTNRDGKVDGLELDKARFDNQQAQERNTTELPDAERQTNAKRILEEQFQKAEAERIASEKAVAEKAENLGPLRSAAIVVFEAETLPAGTLAPDSATLVTLADKVKEAIEATGSEVKVRDGRDATTGVPTSMLTFMYHEGSDGHAQIQQALRDAQAEGKTKHFGIEPGEERQREAAPIARTVALSEQPLAIALDAPNPLLESQLRASGATVSNEPVQERPGLVVVVDTNKGEQLAAVEQTLAKLPPAAVVIETPEASEMRQQLTQNFRQNGGVAPAPQAEATLPERILADVPERLREAGATVAPVVYAERPDAPAGALSVRYPLDQPEVVAKVSVVLDQVNTRSAQIALDLGQAPGAATGAVLETPLAQQARQQVAKEQGAEAAPSREVPERQAAEDNKIARPVAVVLDAPATQAAPLEHPSAKAEAQTRPISLEFEAHPIERRVVLEIDISAGRAGMVPMMEAGLAKAGFEVRKATVPAVGEQEESTRIEARYRTTDTLAARDKQQAVLQNLDTPAMQRYGGISIHEPEGQAQERQAALKGVMPILKADGKPDRSLMVGDGQTLKATVTVLEANGEKERTGKLWEDLRSAGGKVENIGIIDAGAEGTKFQFQMAYNPGDARMPKLSATLESAAQGDGIQVTETDNMRRERLARAALVERKELAKLSPEQQASFERPAAKEYPASVPGAYERVALTSEELKTPQGVKDLRAELKETGATVAVQQLDNRPAGNGTVVLSYLAEGPKAAAVNEVVANFAEKGGHVYDLKAGTDRGQEVTQPQVAAGPLSAEQERQANLAEMRALEARREELLKSQSEGLAKSQAAEAMLVPGVAAAAVAVETPAAKEWVRFGPDLRGEPLNNMDASGMDLRGANLAGQDLRTTDLRGSDLREANLTGADLRGVNLTGVRLEDAVMEGAQLEKAFRVVENDGGKRQVEDNLTPAVLTAPEKEGGTYQPTVAMNEQRLATPEMVAAGQDNSPAIAPRIELLQAPQFSGLDYPTEAEVRQQQQQVVEEPQAAVLTAPLEMPGLRLPTEAELAFILPTAEPVAVELPAVAAGGQEPRNNEGTLESVGLAAPAAAPALGSLSRYEEMETAGTAWHAAFITVTQTVGAEAGQEKSEAPDRLREVQDRLAASGADVELRLPTALDDDGKSQTTVLVVQYQLDESTLPALHKALAEVAVVGDGYGVRVDDENAPGRAASAESRMQNTPEAAKALAAELHDGNTETARLLIQRPALDDVYALEEAGAKVERIYLPEGPAAMVSYPANEPGVTSAVSIEMDRIERDSERTRPLHNSNDREVSGPLLGEDPAQQERRQEMAKAEGLTLEPAARYEPNEMADRDGRRKSYYQEELANPSELTGKLASGEQWKGGPGELAQLEPADREAMKDGWKAETTTLLVVVQEAPSLRMDEQAPAVWSERVAEALRESGTQTEVRDLGISADTGLEKHVIAVTFDNSSPELARINATLNRLSEQDGVMVSPDGAFERSQLVGPEKTQQAEPVVAERERPWLEAVVALSEPTPQERRELTLAGARIEDVTFTGTDQKPALMVYYDLDNPLTVAKVSPVLDRAEEQGRLLGESHEGGQARAGRVEQYQADIRQEKQQGGQLENEVGEPAVKLGFADRLRAAVQDQVEAVRRGWEAASPENLAIYRAEQQGIADRKALEQQKAGLYDAAESAPQREAQQAAAQAALEKQSQAEKIAYERGFNGPPAEPVPGKEPVAAEGALVKDPAGKELAPAEAALAKDAGAAKQVPPTAAEIAAAAGPSGGMAAGANGAAAEVFTDKMLRERRDDERTVPIVIDGPKEGKVLETTEQVKPGIAAVAETPTGDTAKEKIAQTPPPPVVAPEVLAPLAKAPEKELQQGIIGMEGTARKTAEERMEMVRVALVGAGASVETVVPSTRDNQQATLNYAYNPGDKNLPGISKVLSDVQASQPSMIKEEPHSRHFNGITANEHEIEKKDWPERQGQFNRATIVVDDVNGRGDKRAEAVKDAFMREGAIVSEPKKDGHGHVALDVTYHTHSPNIEKINTTLDQAGAADGIEVREQASDRSARYQGANDLVQSKAPEKERERE